MKVTIIGSGTMVPSRERNSSGVLVESKGIRFMVDFGYGTMHSLLKLNLTYHDIDRIYFTHNHPDHMCDLVPFLFASKYHGDPRKKDLEIINYIKFLLKEKGLTINGVKRILNDKKHHSIDDATNLGVYKPSLKTSKIITNKIKNIAKIIKELKNLKNG